MKANMNRYYRMAKPREHYPQLEPKLKPLGQSVIWTGYPTATTFPIRARGSTAIVIILESVRIIHAMETGTLHRLGFIHHPVIAVAKRGKQTAATHAKASTVKNATLRLIRYLHSTATPTNSSSTPRCTRSPINTTWWDSKI